jgi:hypothetical protein
MNLKSIFEKHSEIFKKHLDMYESDLNELNRDFDKKFNDNDFDKKSNEEKIFIREEYLCRSQFFLGAHSAVKSILNDLSTCNLIERIKNDK